MKLDAEGAGIVFWCDDSDSEVGSTFGSTFGSTLETLLVSLLGSELELTAGLISIALEKKLKKYNLWKYLIKNQVFRVHS